LSQVPGSHWVSTEVSAPALRIPTEVGYMVAFGSEQGQEGNLKGERASLQTLMMWSLPLTPRATSCCTGASSPQRVSLYLLPPPSSQQLLSPFYLVSI
jgi:hypothetical protein